MDPKTWKSMVVATRNLEKSMGDGIKKVEKNETETVVLQRRSIRVTRNFHKGEVVKENLEFQRPCPKDAIIPNDLRKFLGKKLNRNLKEGAISRELISNKWLICQLLSSIKIIKII